MCDKLTTITTRWEKDFDIATVHYNGISMVLFGKEYQAKEYAFKVSMPYNQEEISMSTFFKVISNIEKCILLSNFQWPDTITPFDPTQFEFEGYIHQIGLQEFLGISTMSDILDMLLKKAIEIGKSKKLSFFKLQRMPILEEWQIRKSLNLEHMETDYGCYSRFTYGFYSSEG